MVLTNCVLTRQWLDENTVVDETVGPFASYKSPSAGKVIIAIPTLISFENSSQKHPVLAGVCREAFEKNVEPPMITQNFIENDLKNIQYPNSFKEKWLHFLKVIYNKGGNDYKPFDIQSDKDYPICYSDDEQEFTRILEYLEENLFIKYQAEKMTFSTTIFRKLLLTDYGISEVEKDLPNIPLIGLINQKVSTGNVEIDDKVNHAKELFFREPQTIDRMRSACETLSFVLEPLRQDLKKYFNSKDTEDFFNIVNNFDIRHNKDQTKDIQHPEQLEWIFYSLLNTITAYTKLKTRIG